MNRKFVMGVATFAILCVAYVGVEAEAGLFSKCRGGADPCAPACCEPAPVCAPAPPVCAPAPVCAPEPVCCDPCAKKPGLFARMKAKCAARRAAKCCPAPDPCCAPAPAPAPCCAPAPAPAPCCGAPAPAPGPVGCCDSGAVMMESAPGAEMYPMEGVPVEAAPVQSVMPVESAPSGVVAPALDAVPAVEGV